MSSRWMYNAENTVLPNLLSSSDIIDDEHIEEQKLIAKYEKRFDQLSGLFTIVPSGGLLLRSRGQSVNSNRTENLNQLKFEYKQHLCFLEEHSYSKISAFYESSLFHTRQIMEEMEKLHSQQNTLVSNYKIGDLIRLKPQNTCFDELASISATLKMHTTHWIQWKQTILTNRWYYRRLNRYLDEYSRNLNSFYIMCQGICSNLHSLINYGIFVLCRLSEDAWLDDGIGEYGPDFFSTFDHLNGVQDHLRELKKSINACKQGKMDLIDWNLHGLLVMMAGEDGRHLAERVAVEFHKYLTNIDLIRKIDSTDLSNFGMDYLVTNGLKKKVKMVKEINVAQLNVLPCNNNTENGVIGKNQLVKSAGQTSDYFSSSASSSKTIADIENPTEPVGSAGFGQTAVDNDGMKTVKDPHQFLLAKKTKKLLENFYTNFLERRYAMFNYLLDEGAKHNSLHVVNRIVEIESVQAGNSGKKSVKWLDDTLKKNKKQMWRAYVETLWSTFLEEWQLIVENGYYGYSSIRILQYTSGTRLASIVLETLSMVQLPKELSPCDILVHEFRRCIFNIMLDCDINELLCSLGTSKPVSTYQERFDHIYKIANAVKCTDYIDSIKKLSFWISCNQAVSQMSGFDLIKGYAMVSKYLVYLGDEEMGMKFQYFLDTFVESKSRWMMRNILSNSFPAKKYWRSGHTRGDSSSCEEEYVELVKVSILDAVLNATKHLDNNIRTNFILTVLDEIVRSWLKWIKEREFRFSQSGAINLRNHFQTIQQYVQSTDWLSEAEQEAVSNSVPFQQASTVLDVLEGKQQVGTSSVIFSKRRRGRNIRVTPKNEDDEGAGADDTGQVSLNTDLHIWSQYRAKCLLPSCSCFW